MKNKKVKELLNIVIKSCEEGRNQTWDTSTEEGLEGFDDMIDLLEDVKVELEEMKVI